MQYLPIKWGWSSPHDQIRPFCEAKKVRPTPMTPPRTPLKPLQFCEFGRPSGHLEGPGVVFFVRKSQSKMDDWGYPHDLGNLHFLSKRFSSRKNRLIFYMLMIGEWLENDWMRIGSQIRIGFNGWQKLDHEKGESFNLQSVIKRGWLENPRTKWRFIAGKTRYIYIKYINGDFP